MRKLLFLFICIFAVYGKVNAQYKININFDSETFPPAGWTMNDPASILSRTTDASGFGFGLASLKADFFNVADGSATLNTPVFNNLTSDDTLSFDYAYAPYTGLSPDSLIIKISTNNGATFSVILASYRLLDIQTAPASDFEFIPGGSEWATIKLRMVPGVKGNNTQVQFYFSSAFGNNLYIDNILLGNTHTADAQVLSLENTGTQYFRESVIIPQGRYRNNGTTPASFQVTRTISPGGYTSTKNISSLAPGANATLSFDGWAFSPGTPYTVKDSLYLPGDANGSNDTASGTFIPNVAKPILIYWNDAASKDSIITQLTRYGLQDDYDLYSMSAYNGSLTSWNTIFALFGTGVTWTPQIRDSLKTYLDHATIEFRKTLVLFADDIATYNDPISNSSASAADTVFLRQYIGAKYIGDNWLTAMPNSVGNIKGVNNFSSLTSCTVTGFSPDFVQPIRGRTPVLIPSSEDGNGDSCTGIIYSSGNINLLYGTNSYSKYSTNTNQLFDLIEDWILDSNGILPVELASFTGNLSTNSVTLNWTTATEENNSGFDIERKSSAESWQKIGFVTGKGNSTVQNDYTFSDRNLNSGNYKYRLKQIDYNGNYKYYYLSSEINIGVPNKFSLKQNYPNPFNPVTNIEYEIPKDSKVILNVYDITGRLVSTLVNEIQKAGYYKVQFDLNKINLASGVYIYQIISENSSENLSKSMKMLLIK